jgi:hypothetical protein
MAVITPTDPNTTSGSATITETTLTADDTFAVVAGKKQLLILRNDTGGTLPATIDGDAATTAAVPGLGVVDLSAGKAFSVPAGAKISIMLNTISAYTAGVAHILGGTGLKAQLFNI